LVHEFNSFSFFYKIIYLFLYSIYIILVAFENEKFFYSN
jgi:uncharacterized membrane protein (DUF485 family)